MILGHESVERKQNTCEIKKFVSLSTTRYLSESCDAVVISASDTADDFDRSMSGNVKSLRLRKVCFLRSPDGGSIYHFQPPEPQSHRSKPGRTSYYFSIFQCHRSMHRGSEVLAPALEILARF